MYLLRRAAVRSVSSPSTAFLCKPRTIVTKTPFTLRTQQSAFQRRFASNEANDTAKAEAELKSEANEAKNQAAENYNEAKQQVQEKAGEAQEKAGEVKEQATEKYGEAKDQAAEKYQQAKEQASDASETFVEKAKSAAQSVSETVSETAASAAETFQGATRSAARTMGRNSPFSSGRDDRGTFAQPKPSKILYIGNLFFEVTAPELEREFAKFGTVVNSRIAQDPKGLSKGFGYIEFSDVESATKAIQEMDQKQFEGRRMAVQYHVRREHSSVSTFSAGGNRPQRALNEPSKTLFIGNMSFQMTDKDLNDAFRDIRNLTDVRVAIDRRSGQPRGFAHADFIDIKSAQAAKDILENKTIFGRQLRVDFSRDQGASHGNRDPIGE